MRHLFLRFPLEDCLGMMAPQLWSSGLIDDKVKASSVKIQLFPAETLALWNNVSGRKAIPFVSIMLKERILTLSSILLNSLF